MLNLIFAWGGMAASLCAAEAAAKAAKVQGYDLLAPEGAAITLRAKVERDGFLVFDPDLEGARVRFELEGRTLGAALSDGDGVAALSVASFGPGTHRVRVVLDPSAGYQSRPAWLTAAVAARETPILITDLDGTVVDGSGLDPATRDNAKIIPLPGAPEALNGLAAGYQVLYLTARDDFMMNKTKSWLDHWLFPLAPAYFWDFKGAYPTSRVQERYKREAIASLKRVFPNAVAGVGDRLHDVRAYAANGLRSYLIGDEVGDGEALPRGVTRVESWDEIVEDLTSE